MLVCYLDDSGKNKQSAFTCLAGYVAPEEVWAEFEKNVEPVLKTGVGASPPWVRIPPHPPIYQ